MDASHHEIAVAVSNLRAELDGASTLYRHVGFTLGRSERMLITGPNGAGKTTLLDMIAGIRVPQEGSVFLPAGTVTGYLRQDITCQDADTTVIDTFRQGLDGTWEEHIAQLLSYQLFRFEEFRLLCGKLSPGQHRKLMIAKLMASGANLLLLDEPTNHISFPILEEFEHALDAFPGAIIAVSHDRRFIDGFHGTVWTLDGGMLAHPPAQVLSDEDKDRMKTKIHHLSLYANLLGGGADSLPTMPLSGREK